MSPADEKLIKAQANSIPCGSPCLKPQIVDKSIWICTRAIRIRKNAFQSIGIYGLHLDVVQVQTFLRRLTPAN